jgi:hypothetical protein
MATEMGSVLCHQLLNCIAAANIDGMEGSGGTVLFGTFHFLSSAVRLAGLKLNNCIYVIGLENPLRP